MSSLIVSPVSELYLDGLFCYMQVNEQKNIFIKWRYSRLAILAFYCSLEAAINVSDNSIKDKQMAEKWKIKFHFPDENTEWEKFQTMKRVRKTIAHYDNSRTRLMYQELSAGLKDFKDITRSMLSKIYSEDILIKWEENITPRSIE